MSSSRRPQSKPRIKPLDFRESYTVDEIAVRHGVDPLWIMEEIQSGHLAAARLGDDMRGPLRVPADAEREWIKSYHPRSAPKRRSRTSTAEDAA